MTKTRTIAGVEVERVPPSRVPRFRNGTSHTWDGGVHVTLPDGTETNGWIDSTWGEYVYFRMDSSWWRIRHWDMVDPWIVDLKETTS